tara:strand:+ start:326 stop:1537 length:1212 start_codon:yes stop_codon:yes gene_type:complete
MSNKSINEILSSIEDFIARAQAQTGFAAPVGWDTRNSKDNPKKKLTKDVVKKTAPAQKMPRSPELVNDRTSFRDDNGTVYKFNKKDRVWISADKKLSLDIASGYKKLIKSKHVKIMGEEIIKEGGNVFKTEQGPMTQRIATNDVQASIDFIEKITGLTYDEEDWLGTTGKKNDPDGAFEKNSSGDLDLNTDASKISKAQLIAKLTVWLKRQGIDDTEIMNVGRKKTDGWIHDAGDQVHFRTPIAGNSKNGFVQTDFMFTDNPEFQRGAKRGGTPQYGGTDRAILLSSIARGRGLKFSPKFGLVDPNKGDEVVASNWNEIAPVLLGKGATESDTHTVETMLAFLKKDPNYEELIAPWKETMAKAGKEVPEAQVESLEDKQLARIKALTGALLNSSVMVSGAFNR